MDPRTWLSVTYTQAFQFFLEHLKDVTEGIEPPADELVYNASVLAHFASTSTTSTDNFPACPESLLTVFDVFVMDRSQHLDPDIMEAAASQCLLLAGFFQEQQRRRHNVDWYARLGMTFYDRAAVNINDQARSRMMMTMARRFGFWQHQLHRLAKELREAPSVIRRPAIPEPPLIM